MADIIQSYRCTLVVHDNGKTHPEYGYIKQVTTCLRREMDLQAANHPDHTVLEMPDWPDAHPDLHMVHLELGILVARVAPPNEARAAKISQLERACLAAMAGGFASEATGKLLQYQSGPQHQTDFLHAVHAGGDLELEDGTAAAHTPEQGGIVLADFVKHRDAARARLRDLKAKVAAAMTGAAIDEITW